MLKRSPGPKVRGMPSSTIGLPEGSFLVDFVTEYSYPSRKIEQKGGFVLWKEEGILNGTLQEFRGLDSSHLAQVAILVQTITSEFLKWTGRCCLYPLAIVVLQLLAGNCLPYHQPNCPTTDKPMKVLEPTWFLLTFRGRRFCLHAFLGVLLPTTLVHSQLHQRHLMQTTWFDGAHLRVCKQTANIQPFFQSRPMPKRFLGVKVHW